jgi:hypothetical protein
MPIEENRKPESMDVDQPGALPIPDASPASTIGSQFTEFREGRRDSVDSTGYGFATESKRPSFFSNNSHDSGVTAGSLPIDAEHLNGPLPMSTSHGRAREPSPISELDDPVQSVLEGMRVQRMSLCQSLRQYLFVYRGEFCYLFYACTDQQSSSITTFICSTRRRPSTRPTSLPIRNIPPAVCRPSYHSATLAAAPSAPMTKATPKGALHRLSYNQLALVFQSDLRSRRCALPVESTC